MTTIATDGKTMAGDGLVVSNTDILKRNDRKVFLVGREVVGCAGLSDVIDAYIKFLRNEEEDPPTLGDDFNAIHVSKKGCFLVCGNNYSKLKVDLPFAIGAGADYAVGAMMAGKTPKEAIQITAKKSTTTGGRITVLEVPQ